MTRADEAEALLREASRLLYNVPWSVSFGPKCAKHSQEIDTFLSRSESAPAAHLEPGIALPEWRYDPKHSMLYSSNFTHDAALHLTGDFADDAQRTAYASQIVAALNALNASGGGAEAMRERCARVCNALADKWSSPYGTTTWPYAFRDAAAAIRAMPLHNEEGK